MLASGLLTFHPLHGFAGDVRVNLPATARKAHAAQLVSGIGHAFLDYLAACSLGNGQLVARALASDAVVEYARAEQGIYLTVDAIEASDHCDGSASRAATGEHVSNFWVFPTNNSNTVFVSYNATTPVPAPLLLRRLDP
ncbi:MAG: hypothetical protein ACREUL_05405 [Steroidobacteraceae bacterium]